MLILPPLTLSAVPYGIKDVFWLVRLVVTHIFKAVAYRKQRLIVNPFSILATSDYEYILHILFISYIKDFFPNTGCQVGAKAFGTKIVCINSLDIDRVVSDFPFLQSPF